MILKDKIHDVISETAVGWLDNSDEIADALVVLVKGICPFCGLDDFDLPGLKDHLTSGRCNKFEETEILD